METKDDADEEKIDTVFRDKVVKFVQQSTQLLLDGQQSALETAFENADNLGKVTNYISGDDMVLILEKKNKVTFGDQGTDVNDSAGDTYTLLSEIPSELFENLKVTEISYQYIVFIKKSEGALFDDGNNGLSSQILVSLIDPKSPITAILPLVRHSFVPLAVLYAEHEDNNAKGKQMSLLGGRRNVDKDNNNPVRGVLEKLRDLGIY